MPDIFLSYSREDLARARHFAQGFEREGLTVWWDQALDTGVAFDRVTEKALEEARAVVVLWSRHSVESRWVRSEATLADDHGKLIPVSIEPCKRPIMFHLTQTADLSHWKGDPEDASWRELVSSLRRTLDKGASGGAAHAGPAFTAPRPGSGPSRKIRGIAIGIAALLLAGAIAFALSRMPGRQSAQSTDTREAQASAAPVTLAVLPFANLSSDPEQEYFSEGLTEEIRSQLAQVSGLRVTGRTSSFSFKGKEEDARVIGKTLGVANLLEGSIRKEGKQLRITAQLIDSADGAEHWSKTYERSLDDVFRIQQDIAGDVAQALKVTLGVTEEARVPGMTRNPEAYEAYLAGNALGFKFTPDATRQSIKAYQRALALDPSFAMAWAALSQVYRKVAPLMLAETSPQVWSARADEAVAQAARLVPDAFYVHLALGDQSYPRNAWLEAGRHYRDGIAAARAQGVQFPFAIAGRDDSAPPDFQFYVGKFRSSIEALEATRAEDPLDPGGTPLLGEVYAAAGNFDASFAERERGLKLGGNWLLFLPGNLYTALATRDRALIDHQLAALRAAGSDNAIRNEDFMDLAIGALIDRPEQALSELRRRAQHPPNVFELGGMANWMAYFGDSAGALDILRSDPVFKGSGAYLAVFMWRPVMRDVRRLPGFKQLVRDMGLVDYWREFGWPDLCKPVGSDDFECT
jgi:TolB-like protein